MHNAYILVDGHCIYGEVYLLNCSYLLGYRSILLKYNCQDQVINVQCLTQMVNIPQGLSQLASQIMILCMIRQNMLSESSIHVMYATNTAKSKTDFILKIYFQQMHFWHFSFNSHQILVKFQLVLDLSLADIYPGFKKNYRALVCSYFPVSLTSILCKSLGHM